MSRWVCVWVKETTWGARSFFHWLSQHWFLKPEAVETYLPGTGIMGWGTWCGAGTPQSWDIPPEFLSTIRGWGTSLFCVCAPPTSLDGCGFFNSVVVTLPLSSISDSFERWFFYILVVILIRLCEEQTMSACAAILTRSPQSWSSWI